MRKNLIALLCGVLFGLGLAISQMINPEKVLAFLDVTGNWDPSLVIVLLSAVGVSFIGYRWILRWPHPAFAEKFYLPTRRDIDAKLLIGAAIFGVGWGMAGYCPGPAIAAVSLGILEPVIFVVSVLAGSYLYKWTATG